VTPSAAKVDVRHLRKSYGNVQAVRDVSFTIEAGEIFGLLGPNGAGKTSTLECLVGLREADAGELTVCGLDARLHPREVKQKIGVALQSTALPDQLTAREALKLFGSFYRKASEPSVLLERFALKDKADARYATLSGGQRQRLALALAFVNQPELVLLDEPTTGLDPQSRRELHAEIARMKQDGHTVLLSTHYLEEAERLCDRIAIIVHGRIVAMGTPRDLIAASSARQLVTLVSKPLLSFEQLARLPGVEELEVNDTSTRFRTARVTATLSALTELLDASGSEVIDLQVRKSTLEDVFLQFTGESQPGTTTA
jgi:ABC-2 type transport system ATP-binding protein